jgi:hypothetical protein
VKTLRRWHSVPLACIALLVPVLATGAFGATPVAAASTAAACTFNGSTLPLAAGVTEGGNVQVDCTGLEALHPYLLLETSLVVALDPATASLLSGTISPGTLLSVLAAIPMINLSAIKFAWSNLSGDLDYTYTTPTNQALDPNASCPPSTQEINSGLIGCGLALVNLTTAAEVPGAGALLEYKGDPFLPPPPTLAVSPKHVSPGQTVTVSDAKGATTYWWLATLASLAGDLGGTTPPPPTITVKVSKVAGTAANTVAVSPASYNGVTLTPPVLSGTFTVPSTAAPGKHTVKVTYVSSLDGLPLGMTASATINVS